MQVGGRPKHPIWQFFQQPEDVVGADGKKKRRARCNFCDMELSANPIRMKLHISRRCEAATDAVKSMCAVMAADNSDTSPSTCASPAYKKRSRESMTAAVLSAAETGASSSSSERLAAAAAEKLTAAVESTPIVPATSASADGPKVILCYGDSLTWGFDADDESGVNRRLEYDARWTTVLQNELGSAARVIPEGLNRRTTVFENPLNGMYSVNGRKSLPVILHSHKPIDLVILQLGVNDMRHIYNTRPCDIARGLEVLLQDIKVSTVGPGSVDPDVLVLSPPLCRETATAQEWGFLGCQQKSIETIAEFASIVAQHPGVHYLDISRLCKTGSDGIHLSIQANFALGKHVASKVLNIFDTGDDPTTTTI